MYTAQWCINLFWFCRNAHTGKKPSTKQLGKSQPSADLKLKRGLDLTRFLLYIINLYNTRSSVTVSNWCCWFQTVHSFVSKDSRGSHLKDIQILESLWTAGMCSGVSQMVCSFTRQVCLYMDKWVIIFQ